MSVLLVPRSAAARSLAHATILTARRPTALHRAALAIIHGCLCCCLSATIVARLPAQTCTTFDPPCPPDQAPSVYISPNSGSTYTDPDVTITIHVEDDYGLDVSTWSVTLSGAIGGSFSFSPGPYPPLYGTSTRTIHLQPGSSNTVSATVCDFQAHCTTRVAGYTYDAPPPPPQKAYPALSLAPHNGAYRSLAGCAACGDATIAYSTPAYMSRDVARSISLVYSSALAYPQGFVQLDAFDNSLTPPSKMSLKLKRPDGSFVTFVGGTQEIFYSSGNGTTRLAAQFDASALSTGAYDYTAVVKSWWGTDSRESTIPVRILILNEAGNSVGQGWSIAGVERLLLGRVDSAVVVVEGGSIGFFELANCSGGGCSYTSPAGDFSELGYSSATGKYTRSYLDGVVATFSNIGSLETVADRYGNTTSFTWSGNRLTQLTDPAGKAVALSYATYGSPGVLELDEITDPAGRVTSITRNSAGDILSIEGPDGVTALSVAYDAYYRLTTSWDRTNARTDVGFGAYSTVDTITAPQVSTSDAGTVRPITVLRSLAEAVLPVPGTGSSSNPLCSRGTRQRLDHPHATARQRHAPAGERLWRDHSSGSARLAGQAAGKHYGVQRGRPTHPPNDSRRW